MLEALKRLLPHSTPAVEDKQPGALAVATRSAVDTVLRLLPMRDERTVIVNGTKVTPIEAVFGGLLAGMSLNEIRDFESYLKAGSKRIWALWKACDVIASVMMDTTFKIQKIGGDGTAIQNSPAFALLVSPNEFETWSEFLYRWLFHIKLTGNAFWVKDQPNLNGDKPKRLFSLNPKRVRIVVDKNAGLIGYKYAHPSGIEIPFGVEEIIHFKRPHPDKDFWGIGDVEAAEAIFQENINRSTWSSKFWKNGASPSGILICEDAQVFGDKVKFEEAKKKWSKEYGGADNSGKTAWLTGKWKYEQLGMSAVEMQHIENDKWNVEQIFAQCGVPLTVAGLKDAANFATARQDDLRFRRYTVRPHFRWLTERLNRDLIAGFDVRSEIVFEIAGLTDVNQIATDYAQLFDRGCLTINEMRALMNLAKSDNPLADQLFISSTLVPIEFSGISPTQPAQAAEDVVKKFIAQQLSAHAH